MTDTDDTHPPETDGNARVEPMRRPPYRNLVSGILFLLMATLGFSALLNISPIMNGCLVSLIPHYLPAIREVRGQSGSQGSGNDMPAIREMADLQSRMAAALDLPLGAEAPPAQSLSLMDDQGTVLASTDGRLLREPFPRKKRWRSLTVPASRERIKGLSCLLKGDTYYIRFPGPAMNPPVEGSLVLGIPSAPVSDLQVPLLRRMAEAAVLIGIIEALILAVLTSLLLRKAAGRAFPRAGILGTVFGIAVVAQSFFSGWTALLLAGLEPGAASPAAGRVFQFMDHLHLLPDAATVLVISVFFCVELLIFFSQRMERPSGADTDGAIHYALIRPVIFLLMFGVEMSLSFVPLYMELLYIPIPGWSRDMVLSLPVSVSVFFTGLALLFSGAWTDRRGWEYPFLAGILVAGMGLLYAWQAPNAFHFIAARAVSGTGYGLFFMAAQGFIIRNTDQRSKARGFASLFAALYAGIICGNATGAMLVDRIGYPPVFLLGAVIVMSAIPYSFLFLRHAFRGPVKTPSSSSAPSPTSPLASPRPKASGRFLRFLGNRDVFAVTVFSSIPANMAMIGFLNYFNPVYLNRLDVSTADIGRIFMIYGCFIIYGGPLVGRFIDASENKKAYLIGGGFLGAGAFLLFALLDGVSASIGAVLLLGISQSFVFVTQVAYLLKLPATRELGDGMAIGTFRAVNRFGQALGPMMFGWLIGTMSFQWGVISFGLAYIAITIAFGIMARSDVRITQP